MSSQAHPQKIQSRIDCLVKLLRSSSRPWRGEYVEQMSRQVKKLLSSGQPKTASLLLERLENLLEKWKPAKTEDKLTKKAQDRTEERIKEYLRHNITQPMITPPNNGLSLIAQQITSWDSQTQVDSKIIWNMYQQWNNWEAQAWDSLGLVLFNRLKFLHHLDFDEDNKMECGPYNQRYNIIRALKYLIRFNSEWLENYLLLYDYLQDFEKIISELLSSDGNI